MRSEQGCKMRLLGATGRSHSAKHGPSCRNWLLAKAQPTTHSGFLTDSMPPHLLGRLLAHLLHGNCPPPCRGDRPQSGAVRPSAVHGRWGNPGQRQCARRATTPGRCSCRVLWPRTSAGSSNAMHKELCVCVCCSCSRSCSRSCIGRRIWLLSSLATGAVRRTPFFSSLTPRDEQPRSKARTRRRFQR